MDLAGHLATGLPPVAPEFARGLHSVYLIRWQQETCRPRTRPSDMATKSIDVDIFGTTYRVRAEQDREYLQELAATVDRRMREIAGPGSKVDPGRVAVLAALNLADELFRQQRLQEGERVRIEETAARLAGELEQALSEENPRA